MVTFKTILEWNPKQLKYIQIELSFLFKKESGEGESLFYNWKGVFFKNPIIEFILLVFHNIYRIIIIIRLKYLTFEYIDFIKIQCWTYISFTWKLGGVIIGEDLFSPILFSLYAVPISATGVQD